MNLPDASKVSAAFRAANPHLYDQNPHAPNPWQAATLEPSIGNAPLAAGDLQTGDSGRFLIRVTSVRKRLADEDGLCEKYHVDCCRYAGLIPGDSPEEAQIETRQRKAEKGEEEHTMIEIWEPEAVNTKLGRRVAQLDGGKQP